MLGEFPSFARFHVLPAVVSVGAVTAVALAPDSDVVLPAVSVITEQVLLSPASLPGDQPTGSISGFSQTEIEIGRAHV